MCGSKTIPAFDLKASCFMLVLGNIIGPRQLRYNIIIMVSKIIPAFDLKGFMLVLSLADLIIDKINFTDAKQGGTICRRVME